MLFLIAMILACLIAFCGGNALKKHPYVFYITAAVVTVVVVVLSQMISDKSITIESPFIKNYVIGIFSKGPFAGALWAVVMWAGALPNGSAPIKKLMPIRGELSILAAIVSLAHGIVYALNYLKRFSFLQSNGRSLPSEFITMSLLGIGILLIMIPLTVMSFKAVRKKMNPKKWKNIQRTAYLFYAFIIIQILVIYSPSAKSGNTEAFLNIITYSVVFFGYAIMRLRKAYVQKKKPEGRAALNSLCTAAFAVIIGGVSAMSFGKAPARTVNAAPADKTAEPAATVAASEVTATTSVSTVSGTTVSTASGTTDASATTATAVSGTAVTTAEKKDDKAEKATEAPADNNDSQEENKQDEPEQHEEQSAGSDDNNSAPETPAAETPSYVYKNGTYSASAMGYSGNVNVTITFENDVMTAFDITFDEDDPEYYGMAVDAVKPAIQSSLSADVDVHCGATYSATGIKDAVSDILRQAKN